jgi:2-(1,2-epoxy-1,2-dihydrophenyl)acetyl-CoA isomerase
MVRPVPADHGVGDDILTRMDGAVAWMVFNRPESRNALTLPQRLHIRDTLGRYSGDPAVRAVVITGSGGSFCAGADLRAAEDPPVRPPGAPERIPGDLARRQKTAGQIVTAAILDCEKPVICALNGVAAGLGAQVALACDLVIAARDARLIEIFTRRGLVPDAGGTYLLSRLVGVHRAKQILMFGDEIGAEEALALGLVNAVVEPGELEATASAWAGRLAAGATRTLALTKWLVNRAFDGDRATSFDDEAVAVELNMHSRDAQEGLAAFVERRDAEFLGW